MSERSEIATALLRHIAKKEIRIDQLSAHELSDAVKCEKITSLEAREEMANRGKGKKSKPR